MIQQQVAFTGTQRGMTTGQMDGVARYFKRLQVRYLRHGGCIGADHQAHDIAQEMGIYCMVHPARVAAEKRADLGTGWLGEVFDPRPPLLRNHDMVRAAQFLIATPYEDNEVLRSGTWATIRFARKLGVPGVIIYQDGLVVEAV